TLVTLSSLQVPFRSTPFFLGEPREACPKQAEA
ncbi:MAG: hypothetical protein ACI87A_002298, partial [Planctomycetota bacterium]